MKCPDKRDENISVSTERTTINSITQILWNRAAAHNNNNIIYGFFFFLVRSLFFWLLSPEKFALLNYKYINMPHRYKSKWVSNILSHFFLIIYWSCACMFEKLQTWGQFSKRIFIFFFSCSSSHFSFSLLWFKLITLPYRRQQHMYECWCVLCSVLFRARPVDNRCLMENIYK